MRKTFVKVPRWNSSTSLRQVAMAWHCSNGPRSKMQYLEGKQFKAQHARVQSGGGGEKAVCESGGSRFDGLLMPASGFEKFKQMMTGVV